MRIFIAGTGRAGVSVGLWLTTLGHSIVGAWNRSEKRRQAAENTWGAPEVAGGAIEAAVSEPCDLVLVCVADRAIASVGHRLHACVPLSTTFVHLSGLQPAAILAPPGRARASLHPLAALSDGEEAVKTLDSALFTLEGDAPAIERLHHLLPPSARTTTIATEHKARYHAAASVAANLSISLVALATRLGQQAGVPGSATAFAELALGSLKSVLSKGAVDALTGPISRGDIETVRRHLEALPGDAREIYRQLSLIGVGLAREQGADCASLATIRDELQRERGSGDG